MSREYEVILHIKGTPEDKTRMRQAFKKAFDNEITPEITKYLENFLLYRPKELKGTYSLKEFGMNHAGLITKALIDNTDTVSVKNQLRDTNVVVKNMQGGKEVQITVSLTSEAAKLFDKRRLSPAAVAKIVTRFDQQSVDRIMSDANKKLKD